MLKIKLFIINLLKNLNFDSLPILASALCLASTFGIKFYFEEYLRKKYCSNLNMIEEFFFFFRKKKLIQSKPLTLDHLYYYTHLIIIITLLLFFLYLLIYYIAENNDYGEIGKLLKPFIIAYIIYHCDHYLVLFDYCYLSYYYYFMEIYGNLCVLWKLKW